MFIFDEKLREDVHNWHGYKMNMDHPKITEEHIALIAALVGRIADARSCSTAEGFTFEEEEVANLLKIVYAAGYYHACSMVRERLDDVNAIVNGF